MGRVTDYITGGRMKTDNGDVVELSKNRGGHHFNGGERAFDKVMWDGYVDDNKLTLTYSSKDGEEGYPGTFQIRTTFHLTCKNELVVDYVGMTSRPTPVNVSSNVFFNLAGHVSKTSKKRVRFSHTPRGFNNTTLGRRRVRDREPHANGQRRRVRGREDTGTKTRRFDQARVPHVSGLARAKTVEKSVSHSARFRVQSHVQIVQRHRTKSVQSGGQVRRTDVVITDATRVITFFLLFFFQLIAQTERTNTGRVHRHALRPREHGPGISEL